MTLFYIVREVAYGAVCSHKPGRTFLNDRAGFVNEAEAERHAELYNSHVTISGLRYVVAAAEESDPDVLKATVCDRFSNP